MYSGEDSSGDALSNINNVANWPLSQSACNMNKDQIDWAALAQQWIQMKESCLSAGDTQSGCPDAVLKTFEEQGEAPMEVVREDDQSGQVPGAPPLEGSFGNFSSAWYSEQAQFLGTNWNNWPSNSNGNSSVPIPAVQQVNFFKESVTPIPLLKSGGQSQASEIPPMDVAKKKTLPAWIREGLEKMEKEKQKQLERQKRDKGSDPEQSPSRENSSTEGILRSIVRRNEESSNEEDNNDEASANDSTLPHQETSTKSREERMEELMLVVRKSLTELLLEVTNEEISIVAQESLRKYKTKGLGAYADSASENSESETENSSDDRDSEEEIKENIRVRQSAFKAIAQEIELSILKSEEKHQPDRSKEASDSAKDQVEGTLGQKVYDKDSGETQPDKKSQTNGKRSRERTSRFSAIKDSRFKTQKTNSYIVQATAIPCTSYDYEKRKTKSSRRNSYSSDSSSDHYESHKYSSRRHTSSRDAGSSRHRKGGDNSHASSDSDDQYKKRKYHKSHSRDRSQSRSRSRSRSYTSRRSEKRY